MAKIIKKKIKTDDDKNRTKIFLNYFIVAVAMFFIGFLYGRSSVHIDKKSSIEPTTENVINQIRNKQSSVSFVEDSGDLWKRLREKKDEKKKDEEKIDENNPAEDIKTKEEETSMPASKKKKVFSIQVLAGGTMRDAEAYGEKIRRVASIREPIHIEHIDNYYKVKIGFFKTRDEANGSKAMKMLNKKEIPAFITDSIIIE